MERHDNVLSNVLVLIDVQIVLVEKVCFISNQSLMQVFFHSTVRFALQEKELQLQ